MLYSRGTLSGAWPRRTMRQRWRKLLRIGLPVLLVLLVVVYGLVSYFIASGLSSVDRKEQENGPGAYGLLYQDVEFLSRDGEVDLRGWYIHDSSHDSSEEGKKRRTVIFVHGINSNRSSDNAVALAASLFSRGYDSLLFDLRAHGNSGGENSTYGYEERWDILGAFDYLVATGVTEEDVGVLGFSMGAGAAVMALAEEPRIRALVADSPYANAAELVNREAARQTPIPRWIMPIFTPTVKIMGRGIYGVDIGALNPEEAVRSIGNPILVIHGQDDQRIPVEHGVRVHRAAHLGSVLWTPPGVEHAEAFQDHPDQYVDRITAYFDSRLDPR